MTEAMAGVGGVADAEFLLGVCGIGTAGADPPRVPGPDDVTSDGWRIVMDVISTAPPRQATTPVPAPPH